MLVYLGLGSNIGSRKEILQAAIQIINERIGKVVSLSAFYDTEPDGFESEHHFLNAACGVETFFSPLEILNKTEAIERKLGRISKSSNRIYHDRTIDIDILLIEDLVIESERLTVPHPLMHERGFVLNPLAEIDPEAVHPVLGKSVRELADNLKPTGTQCP